MKTTQLVAGDVIDLDLSVPGLTKYQRTSLYLRASSIALAVHLTRNTISLVQGSPGSGKSSMTWIWACEQAAISRKSVCWIHIDPVGGVACTSSGDEWSTKTLAISQQLAQVISESKESDAEILVLDGLVQDIHQAIFIEPAFDWFMAKPNRKLVFVSSIQFSLSADFKHKLDIFTFKMPSWKNEEYVMAYAIEGFRNSISEEFLPGEDADEKISDKYYLAGGCARWMFERTVQEVIDEIKEHISRIGTDMNLLLNGFEGIRANNSISHLFSMYANDEVFLVSEHVTRRLAEKCESEFLVHAMKSSLGKNPSFDLWIFEADFLLQVRLAGESKEEKSKRIVVYPKLGKTENYWNVESRRFFDTVDELEVPNGDLSNIWFIPQKWNQPCFDAVQVLSNNCFRFIQVTRSKTHSLKFKYIVQFLNRFPIVQSFEICYVVPNEPEYKGFEPLAATGKLGEYSTKLKKRKEKKGDFIYFTFGLNRHRS
jgi:hypothetical protein